MGSLAFILWLVLRDKICNISAVFFFWYKLSNLSF